MKSYKKSPFKLKPLTSYKIQNKAQDEVDVFIYDEISWFGVDAEEFVKDLTDIKAGTIHLRLNSPGGSVFDGTAIYNSLKNHPAKIVTHIDGLAASIASIVALAGDEVRMGDNAFFMIHEPWSIVIGDSEDLRKEADLLDKVAGTISDIYVRKTGKKENEIKDYMASETWFSAKEALEAGFVDAIDAESDEQAKTTLFDLSVFANVPDELKGIKKDFTKRDLENALRDAGCTQSQAKEILAKGFIAEDQEPRDVSTDGQHEPRDVSNVVEDPQRDVEPAKIDRTMELLNRGDQLKEKYI